MAPQSRRPPQLFCQKHTVVQAVKKIRALSAGSPQSIIIGFRTRINIKTYLHRFLTQEMAQHLVLVCQIITNAIDTVLKARLFH